MDFGLWKTRLRRETEIAMKRLRNNKSILRPQSPNSGIKQLCSFHRANRFSGSMACVQSYTASRLNRYCVHIYCRHHRLCTIIKSEWTHSYNLAHLVPPICQKYWSSCMILGQYEGTLNWRFRWPKYQRKLYKLVKWQRCWSWRKPMHERPSSHSNRAFIKWLLIDFIHWRSTSGIVLPLWLYHGRIIGEHNV